MINTNFPDFTQEANDYVVNMENYKYTTLLMYDLGGGFSMSHLTRYRVYMSGMIDDNIS